MKHALPVIAITIFSLAAQAADYRVAYSPSLAVEVFIDNVNSNLPADWCQKNIQLRLVSASDTATDVLDDFLPQVGKLLLSQCDSLMALPWQMNNSKGKVLARGFAQKAQGWQPGMMADSPLPALFQPASRMPLQHFSLPYGCHFRTWWDKSSQSLFLPESKNLRCSPDGWLEGNGTFTLNRYGNPETVAVTFYKGYPLRNLRGALAALEVVDANNQRLVVTKKDAQDSWLILPFDPAQHLWSFSGTLLIKMRQQEAIDPEALNSRMALLRHAWSAVINPQININVRLVDDLHIERANPATGAWRTINTY